MSRSLGEQVPSQTRLCRRMVTERRKQVTIVEFRAGRLEIATFAERPEVRAGVGSISADLGIRPTLGWREPDSKRKGRSAQHDENGGTETSHPLPSSGESSANRARSRGGEAERVDTRLRIAEADRDRIDEVLICRCSIR